MCMHASCMYLEPAGGSHMYTIDFDKMERKIVTLYIPFISLQPGRLLWFSYVLKTYCMNFHCQLFTPSRWERA